MILIQIRKSEWKWGEQNKWSKKIYSNRKFSALPVLPTDAAIFNLFFLSCLHLFLFCCRTHTIAKAIHTNGIRLVCLCFALHSNWTGSTVCAIPTKPRRRCACMCLYTNEQHMRHMRHMVWWCSLCVYRNFHWWFMMHSWSRCHWKRCDVSWKVWFAVRSSLMVFMRCAPNHASTIHMQYETFGISNIRLTLIPIMTNTKNVYVQLHG